MKKSIGIGVEPPEKECNDPKCPWHGKLPVRGRVFTGVVKSAKSHNTVVVEWGYHKKIPKYERYERRKSRVVAYNPECIHARENDVVIIAECRPLSKTKSFVVVKKTGEKVIEVVGEEKAPEKPKEKKEEKEKNETEERK